MVLCLLFPPSTQNAQAPLSPDEYLLQLPAKGLVCISPGHPLGQRLEDQWGKGDRWDETEGSEDWEPSSQKVWTVWHCSLSRGASHLAKPQPVTGVTFHYILDTHRIPARRATKPPDKFLRNCLGSAERKKNQKVYLFTSTRRKVVTNPEEHRSQGVTAHPPCCHRQPSEGGCFLHNLLKSRRFNINTWTTFSAAVCRQNSSGQDVRESHILPCACTRCWPCQQQHLEHGGTWLGLPAASLSQWSVYK